MVKDIEDTAGVMWRRQFNLIKKMREGMVAPVDTIGCDRLADPEAPEKVRKSEGREFSHND